MLRLRGGGEATEKESEEAMKYDRVLWDMLQAHPRRDPLPEHDLQLSPGLATPPQDRSLVKSQVRDGLLLMTLAHSGGQAASAGRGRRTTTRSSSRRSRRSGTATCSGRRRARRPPRLSRSQTRSRHRRPSHARLRPQGASSSGLCATDPRASAGARVALRPAGQWGLGALAAPSHGILPAHSLPENGVADAGGGRRGRR